MLHKTFFSLFSALLVSLAFLPATQAIEAGKVAKDKQNDLGLYLTSKEASEYMKTHAAKTLFLDIRDPAEVHTTGMPAGVDYNVPFKLINTKAWDDKAGKFKLDSNPTFLQDVEARLQAKGLTKDDRIILICGSGKRAAKSVNAMAKAGYKNVYSVVDGLKGWEVNKLKVDKKLDRNKMYGVAG